jgi:hypothetical protein
MIKRGRTKAGAEVSSDGDRSQNTQKWLQEVVEVAEPRVSKPVKAVSF